MESEKNIRPFRGAVDRMMWERLNGHKALAVWFTGLSGSGKSSIAHEVEKRLFERGVRVKVFDGDNVRHGLCGDLSFSPEARAENTRRIAEMVKLFLENGTICLCAFISPLRADRERVREIVGPDDFHEAFISCSVEECERRDTKGYYRLAREGKIKNYTGISAPYEAPSVPNLLLETEKADLDECANTVVEYILKTSAL
ncbi:adenylyl-sulfate kinase [Pseudodesulfovibrio pelocollis]|uniref:adenylyl-sulfate kinase n=1 Tax=Pseudodesulfovibrio pelocollis TaxID=3051432 RepID=UPI00255B0AB3|nr:adenylyl-sulfate kinase [Pseudodesulfovibrio sp. SB368]